MLYIIVIFVLYSIKIVNCESYSKYSGYSNVFNSNVFSYKNCLSYYSKSSNKNYLTFYNSHDLKNSNMYYSFFTKSIKHSSSRNSYLSLINSYTFSISKYYSNVISYSKPTLKPTSITTLLPTLEPKKFIPVLSFETFMTITGLTQPSLDIKAQSAILIAVASSINISTNYVLFLGQELVTRRKLIINHLLSTYNIKATTQINIPITNEYSNINPSIIYTSLTTNLATAITNGNFITFLKSASISLNSTSTQNVIVSNYSVSQMVLKNNTFSPSLPPSLSPSLSPSLPPSLPPSLSPSLPPSLSPTSITSFNPTSITSFNPTSITSFNPSSITSFNPSSITSFNPTLTTTISDSTKDFSVKELLTILFASMSSFILVLSIYYYVKVKINKKEVPLSIQSLSIQSLSIQSLSIQPLSIQSLSIQPLSIEPLSIEPFISIQEEPSLSIQEEDIVLSINE